MSKRNVVAFLVVFVLAVFLRGYGLDWDQGHHLHPDERFLTMVTNAVSLPSGWGEYLDTSRSSFNPHNKDFGFYVYGTFPVLVTKWLAIGLQLDTYAGVTQLGRVLSVLLELGIVLLVFCLAKRLGAGQWGALVAMSVYVLMPTPMQLARFYAVDTWLVFFLVLGTYLLVRGAQAESSWRYGWLLGAGVSLGLMVGSKVSGFIVAPVLALYFLSTRLSRESMSWQRVALVIAEGLGLLMIVLLVLRLSQPYLFEGPGPFEVGLNPAVVENWRQLVSWNTPETTPPFGLQWIPTAAYWYPLVHLFWWGIGAPLSITLIALFGLFGACLAQDVRLVEKLKNPGIWLVLGLILTVFGYQGAQFAKAMRYFYPAMPFLVVLVGLIVGQMQDKKYLRYVLGVGAVLGLWWALAIVSVYARTHSRVQASYWIYEHIAKGSVVANEHWDDPLPLNLGAWQSGRYVGMQLPLYDPDSDLKWMRLGEQLSGADVIVMSSNRLWRTIAALPERYPESSEYYEKMFSGELGYEQVGVFVNYPCLVPRLGVFGNGVVNQVGLEADVTPGAFGLVSTKDCLLALNTDGAEETFTVYDQPKVVVFENIGRLKPQQIIELVSN